MSPLNRTILLFVLILGKSGNTALSDNHKTNELLIPDPIHPAGEIPGAMRYDKVAASGECLIGQLRTDSQAIPLLEYYELKAPGSTSEERIYLAQGLYQASALYGGKFPPFVGATIKYSSRTGFSRYTSQDDVVDLNRCDKYGNHCGAIGNINPARIIHELGHRFGHQRFEASVKYYDYFETNLKNCYLTGYSNNNSRENVAEILSAFITRPERLSAGSERCKKIFEFLSTKVFRKNGRFASCSTQGKAALARSIAGFGGATVVSHPGKFHDVFSNPGLNGRIPASQQVSSAD